MTITCKKLTDLQVLELVENNTNLSELSKKSYISTIKKIIAIIEYKKSDLVQLKISGINIVISTKTHLFDVINSPKKYIPIFKKIIPVKRSYTACISFILTISKYCDKCNLKKIDIWKNEYANQMNEVHDERTTGLMNTDKEDSYIEWNDVIKKQEELSIKNINSDDTLLLSLYSLIPPRRLKDYYRIFIKSTLKDEENNNTNDDSVIDLTVQKPFILVKDYKTSKAYGEWKKELPISLINIIKGSIKSNPRKYLFISKKNIPFNNGITGINSFTKQTNRELEKIFQKKITINSLRHSFATHQIALYKLNKITFKELDQSAKDMAHSIVQSMLYEQRKIETPIS